MCDVLQGGGEGDEFWSFYRQYRGQSTSGTATPAPTASTAAVNVNVSSLILV